MWCDGRVKIIDVDLGNFEILYNNGEGEVLNLFKEKYKVKVGSKEKELLDRVFVNMEMCWRGLDVLVILYVIYWIGWI